MQAIEFEAYIKNGVIEIPEQYKEFDNSEIKVILLKKDLSNDGVRNILQSISKKRMKVDHLEIPNREERNAR